MRQSKIKSCLLVLCVSVITVVTAISPVIGKDKPDFGETFVLATVPTPPGFPEGIAVRGNRVFVAGPATFGTAGNGSPSRVLSFDTKTGALVQDFATVGEDLNQDHANSCIAFDGEGRLYVLNLQLGVYRISTGSGAQQTYAGPFPNLPICSAVPPGTPCSPTPVDLPPLPNDLAFDDAGNLYVTDSLQATIWRIAPGGGAPQIWFQDSRLVGNPAFGFIGVNGIRLSPDRSKIFITVTADSTGLGFVYTLPLVEHPTPASLQVFHIYSAGEAPDGIAFGRSGELYVALAAPFNSGVSILASNGSESARLTNPVGSPIFPYDSPANIAFDKHGSLLLTNHAFVTGVTMPSQFTILSVFVDDKESPLVKPDVP
ncbi:MAG TPA: SMP-30/gluconolactonase/LRE family protein [Blastocatellia bacterium]|nr:SMP-30/gluconolactonase/LRE family protein [Blastocatellia bacterium]